MVHVVIVLLEGAISVFGRGTEHGRLKSCTKGNSYLARGDSRGARRGSGGSRKTGERLTVMSRTSGANGDAVERWLSPCLVQGIGDYVRTPGRTTSGADKGITATSSATTS
jgi:hypothetical protein